MSENKEDKSENSNMLIKFIKWSKRSFLHPTNFNRKLKSRKGEVDIFTVAFSIVILAMFYIGNFINNVKLNIDLTKQNMQKYKHNIICKSADMKLPHKNASAVLLNDGNVLIIGENSNGAEIYDYKSKKFKITKGKLNYIRKRGTSDVLPDGRVLITGGILEDTFFNYINADSFPKNSEIYNPKTQEFTKISNMCIPRFGHKSVKTGDEIYFIGGIDANRKTVYEIEKFDYKTNSFSIVSTIPNRYNIIGAVKTNEDKILIINSHVYNNFKIIEYDYKNNRYKLWDLNETKSLKGEHSVYYNVFKSTHFDNSIETKKVNEQISSYTTQKEIITTKSINGEYTELYLLIPSYIQHGYYIQTLGENAFIKIGGYLDNGTGGEKYFNDPIIITFSEKYYSGDSNIKNSTRAEHTIVRLKDGNLLIIGGVKYKRSIPYDLLSTEIYYL